MHVVDISMQTHFKAAICSGIFEGEQPNSHLCGCGLLRTAARRTGKGESYRYRELETDLA